METIYSAMKSAQIGFVKALSQELALTSVTVNAITPGFVSGNEQGVVRRGKRFNTSRITSE